MKVLLSILQTTEAIDLTVALFVNAIHSNTLAQKCREHGAQCMHIG